MRRGRVLELERLVDLDPNLAVGDDCEQFLRALLKLGAGASVREQRRAGEVQRPLLREEADVDRLDRARGLAEADHHAARAQAVQRTQKGVAPDRIIDHRKLLAVGQALDLGDEVLVELTPYDLTKGRITYRFMPGRAGPPGYNP